MNAPSAVLDKEELPQAILLRRDGAVGTPRVRKVHGPITVIVTKRGRVKTKPVTVAWGATFNGSQQLGWRGDPGETTSVVVAEEGTTWIKGHHRPGSPQAKALIAAYALQEPA